MGYNARFKVWRGDDTDGELEDFTVEVNEGEVVLDIIHRLQATQTPGPRRAVELQGRQVRLVQRRDQRPPAAAVHDPDEHLRRGRGGHGDPAARLPGRSRTSSPTCPSTTRRPARSRRSRRRRTSRPASTGCSQLDVERSQEFRKCIECFLCQDTCHVIRDHEENKESFAGPRFFIRLAELDMHPLDTTRPQARGAGQPRPRHVQHHQVLHRGLPRAHQDHRQRDHPDEGARRRHPVRPAGLARQQDPAPRESMAAKPHPEHRRRRPRRRRTPATGCATKPTDAAALHDAAASRCTRRGASPRPPRPPGPGSSTPAGSAPPGMDALVGARLGAAVRRRGRPARPGLRRGRDRDDPAAGAAAGQHRHHPVRRPRPAPPGARPARRGGRARPRGHRLGPRPRRPGPTTSSPSPRRWPGSARPRSRRRR